MNFVLYKTRLKCLLRNKENMFWSIMFPIILISCYYLAFNNQWSIDQFKTIPIAYDGGKVSNDILKDNLSKAEMSNGTPIFSVTYCDKKKAAAMLKNGKIEAYIVGSEKPELFLEKNGINQTIIKSFLDSYQQMYATAEIIMKKNPNAMNHGLMTDLSNYDHFLKEQKMANRPNPLLIAYYSILAYSCLFAANWGLDETVNIEADQSNQGARINVSAVHKMKLFLCNMAAAFTVQIVGLTLLFSYMYFGLKIDFGKNMGLIILTCILGSLTGLFLGATIGVWLRKKAEFKEAILLAAVLGGAFLSGMMIPEIKYMIAEKIPILGYLNPVNLVTDSLYSLYYYDSYNRFIFNIGILCLITFLLGIASYIGIRRKNYASI